MRAPIQIRKGMIAAALLAVVILPAQAPAGEPVSVFTSPDSIPIGAQFDGMNLHVEGSAPAGSSVIVRFTGEPTELHLREKGKIFNLLWMNVGTVTVANAPKVCIIDTSVPFAEMGPAAAPYSLSGVAANLQVEKDEEAQPIDVEKELLRLKKKEGLYRESEQGIDLSPVKDGMVEFSVRLAIPPALSPGNYLVEAVAVKDGNVLSTDSKTIAAHMVGFPEWLSELAFQRSLLYGVMATAIAIASGLIIGLVFQSKGAH